VPGIAAATGDRQPDSYDPFNALSHPIRRGIV
jgi:hypothetical protein